MMMRTSALSLAVVVLSSAAATAQEGKLEIIAAGGFLGHVESFCEQPGGVYDLALETVTRCDPSQKGAWPAWLGGVVGIDRWMSTVPALPNRLVLLSGNNAPALFEAPGNLPPALTLVTRMVADAQRERAVRFWDEVARLRPDAIAVGPDDMLRGLRRSTAAFPGAAGFVREVRANLKNLPFIVSNAVITWEGERLNTVEQGEYKLLLDGETSVPWDATLIVEHPCGAAPAFILDGLTLTAKTADCDDDRSLSTLQVPGILKPGHKHLLEVQNPATVATFSFYAHDAVTPYQHAGNEWLHNLPIIWRQVKPAASDGAPAVDVAVISLIDPATKSGSGASSWIWESPACPRRTCALEILDPIKAVKALRRAIDATNEHRRQAFVLLSELSDEDTKNVLEAIPEIRVAILSSGSVVLGRQAADSDNEILKGRPASSGDLGASAIFDPTEPTTRKVAVRPEWFGETGARIVTTWGREPKFGEVTLRVDEISVETVPGYKFNSAITPAGTAEGKPSVTYTTEARLGPIVLATFPAYESCDSGAVSPRCAAFRQLWAKSTFNAIIADAVQRSARTDLVALPDDVADPDVTAWMDRTLVAGSDARWVSRFILDRAVYRSYGIVRTSIEGSKLLDTLQKIAAGETGFGETYCLSGLGRTACGQGAIDKSRLDRVRINGRAVDPRAFYSIAMPHALAASLQLPVPEDAPLIEVEEVLNAALQSGAWFAEPDPPQPLATPAAKLQSAIAQRAAARPLGYWIVPTFDIGYSNVTVGDFEQRTTAPRVVPQEVGGAKEGSTITVGFDSDLSPYDTTRTAVRLINTVGYARKSVEAIDTALIKRRLRSYERNEFVLGGRFDVKTHLWFELRPYAGYFYDGQLLPQVEDLTAVIAPDNKQTVEFATPANRFRHARIGLDALGGQTAWPILPATTVSLTKAGIAWNVGETSDVPVRFSINEVPYEAAEFLEKGPAKLLEAYIKDHPDFSAASANLRVATEARDQRRFDFDIAGSITRKPSLRSYTGEIAYQWRRFFIDDAPLLALRSTKKFSAKATVPIGSRMQIVATYEWQRARIEAAQDGVFQFNKYVVTLNFPFQVRWGNGVLWR